MEKAENETYYGFYSQSLSEELDFFVVYSRLGVDYVPGRPETYAQCTLVKTFKTEDEARKYLEEEYKKNNKDASLVGPVGEFIRRIGGPNLIVRDEPQLRYASIAGLKIATP
jgi:hypothetical protein